MALISAAEYADKHGKARRTVSQMCKNGGFETAMKIGRNWAIDEDEPYPDRRVKSGEFKNWRKPKDSAP